MRPTNLGEILADAWEMTLTLAGYGVEPLTVGWWRGQSYVHLWNWRTGEFEWRAFQTRGGEMPNPHRDLFESALLYDAFFRGSVM